MHSMAEAWDNLNRNSVEHHCIDEGKFLPINRPCDWCGKIVDKGFIHDSCYRAETKYWLDILY